MEQFTNDRLKRFASFVRVQSRGKINMFELTRFGWSVKDLAYVMENYDKLSECVLAIADKTKWEAINFDADLIAFLER